MSWTQKKKARGSIQSANIFAATLRRKRRFGPTDQPEVGSRAAPPPHSAAERKRARKQQHPVRGEEIPRKASDNRTISCSFRGRVTHVLDPRFPGTAFINKVRSRSYFALPVYLSTRVFPARSLVDFLCHFPSLFLSPFLTLHIILSISGLFLLIHFSIQPFVLAFFHLPLFVKLVSP